MEIEVICKACSFGPCKLGDLAHNCQSTVKPANVYTVQDMVNYRMVQILKAEE
jgi:hypothetical protein